MHANTFSDEIEKKHQEGTCSFPICCSEAIEVTSPTNLKDANPKMLGTLQDDLKNSKKSSNSTSHTLQWGNHQMRVLDVTEPCAAATFPSRLDFWRCSHDLTRPGGFLGMAGIQTATYSIIDPPLVGSTMGGIKTFPGFPMVPTGPTSKRHVFFSCQKTKMRHLRPTCQKPCTTLQHVFSYIGHSKKMNSYFPGMILDDICI